VGILVSKSCLIVFFAQLFSICCAFDTPTYPLPRAENSVGVQCEVVVVDNPDTFEDPG
jgi:hypothetical protein